MWVIILTTLIITAVTVLYYCCSSPSDITTRKEEDNVITPCDEKTLSRLIEGYRESKSLLLFPAIKSGDIVFCVMPFSAKQLASMPPAHRARPYVVIETKEHSLLGYACSSSSCHTEKSNQVFRLVNGRYRLWKDGWILLNKAISIPQEYVLRRLDTLTLEDRKAINQMVSDSSRKTKFYFPLSEQHFSARPGCVLQKEDRLYYLWKSDNTSVLLEMRQEPGPIIMNYDSAPWYVDPECPVIVTDLCSYRPVGTPVGSIDNQISAQYKAEFSPDGTIHVSPRMKLRTRKKPEYIFQYPSGQILEFGGLRVLYLYSAADRSGTLKHYGISEAEANNDYPIVEEIPYFESMKAADRLESEELNEIIEDASLRDGKSYLLDLISA